MTKLILKSKQVVQYLDSLVVKKRWINMIGKHTKLSHPLCLPAIYGVTLLLGNIDVSRETLSCCAVV